MDGEVPATQSSATPANAAAADHDPEPASSPSAAAPAPLGPRIEACQFENLLQRAMEILNARHIAAQLGRPRR